MTLLCGVEDAGRGPMIGPLAMCGVMIDKDDEYQLKEMGAKDSKALTPIQRERIGEKIREFAKFKVILVPAKEIDDAVNGMNGLNLNWLEAITSAQIINFLKPDEVVVDCPSPNIQAYTDFLRSHLEKKDIVIHCEHKADVNHPVVSAASIVAKVARDEAIQKIKQEIGMEFGSGYPSDPRSVGFLQKHYNDFPQIFRHTWAPCKKMREGTSQKELGSF